MAQARRLVAIKGGSGQKLSDGHFTHTRFPFFHNVRFSTPELISSLCPER